MNRETSYNGSYHLMSFEDVKAAYSARGRFHRFIGFLRCLIGVHDYSLKIISTYKANDGECFDIKRTVCIRCGDHLDSR